ncbi:hypothetical protein [Amycolatopsis sp. BJA-103]|uniref:hypothetical protein n=1 Tax=Amycolatopsis sp. BJA-103 TaxID=1911175 RepID=UPI001E2AE350|nr:hypothetical protein [Amycolatopsis sp. BJA-103]
MPLEIACDESGSEGEKLIGGQTDVFAHAGAEAVGVHVCVQLFVEALPGYEPHHTVGGLRFPCRFSIFQILTS